MEPFRMRLMLEKIGKAADEMASGVYSEVARLSAEYAVTPEPVPFSEKDKLQYRTIAVGETWSERVWDCAWFRIYGDVPAGYATEDLCLGIDVDGEGCLFDEEGTPIRGITNVSSEFDRALGFPGKRYVPFADHAFSTKRMDGGGKQRPVRQFPRRQGAYAGRLSLQPRSARPVLRL